jgi:uncharacterized protein (TIGR02145 family)
VSDFAVSKQEVHLPFDNILVKGAFNQIEVTSTGTWSVTNVVGDWLRPTINFDSDASATITGNGHVYVNALINTGTETRNGSFTITNGVRNVNVSVAQAPFPGDWSEWCGGLADTPTTMTIGNHEYPVMIYGGNMRQEYEELMNALIFSGTALAEEDIAEYRVEPDVWKYQCWMLENSREAIDPASSTYVAHTAYTGQAEGERGYYYTNTQASMANNACPTGWRLPTQAEFNLLGVGMFTGILVGGIFQGQTFDMSADVLDAVYARSDFYFNENLLAGYFNNANVSDWGAVGYNWSSTLSEGSSNTWRTPYYAPSRRNSYILSQDRGDTYAYPVRCVKDEVVTLVYSDGNYVVSQD